MSSERFPGGKNALTQISDGEGKKDLIRDLLLIGRLSLMAPVSRLDAERAVFGYTRAARVERRIIR